MNGAGTHGNFAAMGQLNFPIFREAKLRGDEDVAQAQMDAVNAQLAELRNHIDEQVRAALLDVNANAKLVDVARSNVDLATRALSDETDRVNAGVDDNLPLVTAQATLATAREQPGGEPVPVQRVEAVAGAGGGRAGAAVPGVFGAVTARPGRKPSFSHLEFFHSIPERDCCVLLKSHARLAARSMISANDPRGFPVELDAAALARRAARIQRRF